MTDENRELCIFFIEGIVKANQHKCSRECSDCFVIFFSVFIFSMPSKVSPPKHIYAHEHKLYCYIDKACSVKMAGFWPRSFLRVSGPQLRLGPQTRKKNLANTQPS